jgi:hypothetical protein
VVNPGSGPDSVPDVIHFYSYETGVSFELPVGFEEDSERPGLAAYVDDQDDAPGASPRVLVQVVGQFEAGPNGTAEQAAAALAKGFAAQGGEVIASRTEVIDEAPTATMVIRRDDPKLGGQTIFHQTAAVSHGKLFSISGIAPSDRQADYVPAFDAAIRSIRFVAL